MKSKVTKIVFAVIMAMCVSNVSAQGFLDKISKGLDKVDEAMKKVDDVTGQLTSATAVDSTRKIQWDKIPEYHAEKVAIKDKDGNVVKNADDNISYFDAGSINNNPIGYVIVRRSKFPDTALTDRNLSILDACFNGNSKSVMSNCDFILNSGYSPIIDLLKSFYVDKTISRECYSTAFSIRPVLSIPNYDDRIIVASNIEDYELRDGSESNDVLVKAFAPYLYFKMNKIGTFVLFDEDGRAFFYDKQGNKKYIVTE